uniref:Glycosyltransferase n=1 Tax=Roseihalotalea indica TaxID=2867963 RepID=A0AA49GPQ3_9BACT|nr:glycosyltransferase [Tunicatimonas sp. TK19036]
MSNPLVSIIALSYNHSNFIEEALDSVCRQTYLNLELIIVDDASTDDSAALIEAYLQKQAVSFPVKTILLKENLGNCAAFNRGLALAQGKYVIDFATDDLLLPQRIAQQVACFEDLSLDYGVVFTEAEYIDETGKHLWFHYQERLKQLRPIPTGEIYAQVVARYFISSPTMMIRRKVLDEMGGYDERLAYEDFDFWVRSARKWKYAYLDICTTKVRKHWRSMSTQQYQKGDSQLYSTYLVCEKVQAINRTTEENQALIARVKYEIRQAFLYDAKKEFELLFRLLQQLNNPTICYYLLRWMISSGLSVGPLLKKLIYQS